MIKGGTFLFLAIKEMKHAKLRFAMIGLIIMLIAWLVFILSGLGNGLSSLAAATMKNIDADYFIYEEGTGGKIVKTKITGDIQEEVLKMDGVEGSALFGQSTVVILNESNTETNEKVDVALLGVEAGNFIEPTVIEGSQLDPAKPLGVLADSSLKNKGFKLGDTLTITSSTLEVEIIGFVQGETFNHLSTLFTNLHIWQYYAFAAPGSSNGLFNAVHAIALQGKNIDPIQINETFDNIETITHRDAVMGMPGYKEESSTIYLMLTFLMVISAIIIAVFFYVFILQKTQQFGVMKAIGASDRFIKNTIIAQVFVLALISIVAGIILTYATALILPSAMPFHLDFGTVLLYGALLLVISMLGSIISARRISKIDPLTALGRVE